MCNAGVCSVGRCLSVPVCPQVGGAGGRDPLPRWLTFDPGRGIFSGVPLGSELGPQLVTVRAIGTDGHSSARDRFMVDVVRERGAFWRGRVQTTEPAPGAVQARGYNLDSRCNKIPWSQAGSQSGIARNLVGLTASI